MHRQQKSPLNRSERHMDEQLSLSELIYLHRLFDGGLVRGKNSQTRALEAMIELRIRELAARPQSQ
jgi:hypothetical protein